MSGRFEVVASPLEGLFLIERKPIRDSRGSLERMFCADEMTEFVGTRTVAQINRTRTRDLGTVRGLHFQYAPYAEMKIVSCLRGEVFDVAVDLRRTSRTFLHWYGERLSADNHRTMVIPEGFGHGFQTLTDDCEMLYFHTAPYRSEAEGGLNVLDPRIGIRWPAKVVSMSERDKGFAMLTSDFTGIDL